MFQNFEYTRNLSGYEKGKETQSCYLDGRYFNKVFASYPGLLPNPLHVKISEGAIRFRGQEERKERVEINMKETNINTSYPGLLRLVITTPKTKHTNLLILDYQNGIVHRFEPLGERGPYFDKVNDLVHSYLSQFFNLDLEVLDVDLERFLGNFGNNELNEKNTACERQGLKSGFCNAYVILYAYSWLNGLEFNPRNIKKFAHKIEQTYGPLPKEGAEIEYDDGPSRESKQIAGTALGGLGGLALAGPVGALAFGGLGLGIGSIL